MAQASPPDQHIHGIIAGPSAMVLAGTFNGYSLDHDDIATRRLKVLDRLRLTDPADDRAEIQSQMGKRVSGTCQWIQNHSVYRDWLQSDCSPLWISGGPGTGKTMLSIFITESLEESKERVIYFFCRHDDEKRKTETAVLRGLLVQLLPTISDQMFDQHVWPSFRSAEAASYTLSRPQTVWSVFQELVTSQGPKPTFCVLDGLDECDEDSSHQLTQRFHDLLIMNDSTQSTASFKLAIVSRDKSGLGGFSNLEIQYSNLDIRHDIELFIASRVRKALSHKNGFNDEVLREISQQLRHRAEGSFLWIGFVAKDLLRYGTSSEVMRALERTPKGLGGQYRRILARISEDHAEDWSTIQSLLAWVALAFVPLTLPQLARAVKGSVSLEHRDQISNLLDYCKDVLVRSDRTGTVRLVHSSAKEFLVEPHPPNQPGSAADRTHVDDGHRTIMRKCLKILEQTAKSDVLKPYANQFLPQHMKACKAVDISSELARPFFKAGDILQSQWESWRLSQGIWSDQFPKATPSPLHIATYWGILPWAQQQLETRSRFLDMVLRRSHLETKDEFGTTPLAIAVDNGDVHMVEWLLQQGAIVHLEAACLEEGDGCWRNYRDSPLSSAFNSHGIEKWFETPQMEIASLLLSHLKKPTWRSILQSRALLFSCCGGDETVALWLLGHFPPPEKVNKTQFECPALRPVLRQGHVQIFEQLLDFGVDIYSSCGPGYTAFSVAIANDLPHPPSVLERILSMLFDVNDKRISASGIGNCWDILLQPVSHNHMQEFSDFAPPDHYTFTEGDWSHVVDEKPNALALAAYYDRGLDLCLKRGNIGRLFDSGYSGRVELICAVASSRVEPVMTLLQNGADVNAVDKHGNSVLTLAIHWGLWDVAQALIIRRAEVNCIGYGDITPLTEAAREMTMKLRHSPWLLDTKQALDFFSSFREQKLKTVSMLLDFGASTHCRTTVGETALTLAANLGDAATVGILVERGARIAIGDQISDRGLWRWFVVFEILRMRGMLSNRCCSGLLADRLHLLAKGRRLRSPFDWYYHFDAELSSIKLKSSYSGRLRKTIFHVW